MPQPIDDITTVTDGREYTFTDGCGECSPDYMQLVARQLGLDDVNISAIQVSIFVQCFFDHPCVESQPFLRCDSVAPKEC